MIHTIQNEHITATASEIGAQLQSIIYDNNEYLWQADPAYWAYSAPILFPIVGKLKGGALLTDTGKYIIENHGICRGRTFKLSEKTDSSVIFSLKSGEETKKVYPYDFELLVTYKLVGKSLITKLDVRNDCVNDLFFSIGGHPAFNCPLVSGETFEDYEIKLNKKEIVGNRIITQDGMISGKTSPFFNDSDIISMDYEHFRKHGTLIFKNLNSTEATLRSKKSGKGVTLGFEGFQYFAVWAKPGAPFVCLEPWQGICDSSFYSGNFQGKTGTIEIAPDEVFSCEFSISPF